MYKGLREFQRYTKRQRLGLYALALSAFLLFLAAELFKNFYRPPAPTAAEKEAMLRQWEQMQRRNSAAPARAWRTFDPNKVSASELESLGLKEYLAERWVKYRSSGARFQQAEDVLRLYGMDSAWWAQAKAYMRFSAPRSAEALPEQRPWSLAKFDPNRIGAEELEAMGLSAVQARSLVNYREKIGPFHHPQELLKLYAFDSTEAQKLAAAAEIDSALYRAPPLPPPALGSVDLNRADSLLLRRIPGINKLVAQKMLSERRELGGFASVEQLLSVWPIDSAAWRKMAPYFYCEGPLQRLNINRASVEELAAHPYLYYRVAKNIVAFRESVRLYKEVEEIQNIELVDPVLFRKIAPYLEVGE